LDVHGIPNTFIELNMIEKVVNLGIRSEQGGLSSFRTEKGEIVTGVYVRGAKGTEWLLHQTDDKSKFVVEKIDPIGITCRQRHLFENINSLAIWLDHYIGGPINVRQNIIASSAIE
jgi:hypothetical protein